MSEQTEPGSAFAPATGYPVGDVSPVDALGVVLALNQDLLVFEAAQERFRRALGVISERFVVEFSTAGGTLEVVSLKPRDFLRPYLAAAKAGHGKRDICVGSLGVSENLFHGVDVGHNAGDERRDNEKVSDGATAGGAE